MRKQVVSLKKGRRMIKRGRELYNNYYDKHMKVITTYQIYQHRYKEMLKTVRVQMWCPVIQSNKQVLLEDINYFPPECKDCTNPVCRYDPGEIASIIKKMLKTDEDVTNVTFDLWLRKISCKVGGCTIDVELNRVVNIMNKEK